MDNDRIKQTAMDYAASLYYLPDVSQDERLAICLELLRLVHSNSFCQSGVPPQSMEEI